MAFDPNAVRSGAHVSTNPTYLGAWVAYINGRFVPIMGFDTDNSVWSIPTFRIHLLPDPVITRLGAEDRVQVVLFYLDHWYDAEKPEMRLLCDGEIVGWGFSNSGGARSIAFTCAAHLSIFQALYFHYMTNVDDIVASRAPEVQATSVATTAGPIYPYGLFHQGLTPTAAQLAAEAPGSTAQAPAPEGAPSPSTPIQSAYELVTNVIRGCISKDVPDSRRALPAMNFVARWIRLTNFHNRWVRMPLLEDPDRLANRVGVFPIFNAVRNTEALTAMQRHVASQVGNAGNIWNLFQQILGLVYMEIGAIPNPCSVLVQLNDTTGGAGSNPVDGRIIGHPTYGTPQVDQRSAGARAAAAAAAAAPATPTTPTAPAAPATSPATAPAAPAAAPAAAPSAIPGISPRTPVRLAQYFVKPQMLTGEVPACNAIFPSQIESWAFDENYAGQPTRVYINDAVMTQALRAEGPNREFMLHALMAAWPEEAHAILHHRAGSTANAAAGPTESGKNLLIWPEEYYKGIVTSRAALPAWFQMLRQFANAQAAKPETPGDAAPAADAGTGSTPPAGGTNAATAPAAVTPPAPPAPAPAATPPASPEAPREGRVERPPSAALLAAPSFAWPVELSPRRTVMSLNGRPEGRFHLGGGLDPAYYVPPRRVAPWPLGGGGRAPARRGRAAPGEQPPQRSQHERLAQLVRALAPACQELLPGVAAAEANTVAFGFAWLIYQENGVRGFFSWALGNCKQYHDYPAVPWTVNPYDRQPYQAGRSFEEAVRIFVADVLRRYPAAVTTLVTGQPPDELRAFLAEQRALTSRYWQGLGVARPDLFYVHLGSIGYYAAGRSAGVARVRGQQSYHEGVARLFAEGRVPPDVVESRDLPASVTRPLTGSREAPNTSPRTVVRRTGAVPDPQAGTAGEGDTFAELFSLYAQYEYERQRAAQRTASAQLAFNPYLVAGFPAMLFDSMATGIHVVGYIQRVGHSGMISPSGARLATTAQLSYARTFYEFLAAVKADAQRFASRVTSAPADVVREIREVTQDEAQAEVFYGRLLHGGRTLGSFPIRGATASRVVTEGQRRAVLRWSDVLGFAESGGRTSPIEISGPSVASGVAEERTPSGATRTLTEQIDLTKELSPRDNGYAEAFVSYDVAMRYAARPCCTLDEYVMFWHGGASIPELQRTGQVGAVRTEFCYATENVPDVLKTVPDGHGGTDFVRGERTRQPAAYYERIYKLRPGPGPEPTPAQRGYEVEPAIAPTTTTEGLPADYPQTRSDWDAALDFYVEKILNRSTPSR